MNLEKALELFSVEDISVETSDTIKKKYKKLMIKYHPDNCNGDDRKAKEVSLALDIIKEALDNIKKYNIVNTKQEKYTIIIPISKLINLYDGGTITVGTGENKRVFNSKDIQKYDAIIISDVSIIHNGLSKDFQSIQHWSISDNYIVNCEIFVEDITATEVVNIKVEDFSREIKFTSQSVSMRVPLKHNITVDVKITKKIRQEEKEE
jgi:hypothetical protein